MDGSSPRCISAGWPKPGTHRGHHTGDRQGERLGQAIACRSLAVLAAREGAGPAAERWLARAERAAAARGSVREQALNALARARLSGGMGHDDSAGVQAAQATLERLGVQLPARSLLTRQAR